jgi:hypothetical protein
MDDQEHTGGPFPFSLAFFVDAVAFVVFLVGLFAAFLVADAALAAVVAVP